MGVRRGEAVREGEGARGEGVGGRGGEGLWVVGEGEAAPACESDRGAGLTLPLTTLLGSGASSLSCWRRMRRIFEFHLGWG